MRTLSANENGKIFHYLIDDDAELHCELSPLGGTWLRVQGTKTNLYLEVESFVLFAPNIKVFPDSADKVSGGTGDDRTREQGEAAGSQDPIH